MKFFENVLKIFEKNWGGDHIGRPWRQGRGRYASCLRSRRRTVLLLLKTKTKRMYSICVEFYLVQNYRPSYRPINYKERLSTNSKYSSAHIFSILDNKRTMIKTLLDMFGKISGKNGVFQQIHHMAVIF